MFKKVDKICLALMGVMMICAFIARLIELNHQKLGISTGIETATNILCIIAFAILSIPVTKHIVDFVNKKLETEYSQKDS